MGDNDQTGRYAIDAHHGQGLVIGDYAKVENKWIIESPPLGEDAQASRVSVWMNGSATEGEEKYPLFVLNGSDLPIYDVHINFYRKDIVGVIAFHREDGTTEFIRQETSRDAWDTIHAGIMVVQQLDPNPKPYETVMPHRLPPKLPNMVAIRPVIVFRDAHGRCWRRGVNNNLVQADSTRTALDIQEDHQWILLTRTKGPWVPVDD